MIYYEGNFHNILHCVDILETLKCLTWHFGNIFEEHQQDGEYVAIQNRTRS